VLWVRAEEARDVVAAALEKQGAIVDEALAYRTVPETTDPTGGQARFREEGADVVTFASGSAVENFVKLGLPVAEGVKFASIGPVTTAALRRHGMKAHIEARQHDIPGLIEAIREHFGR
jgi:uroporphyrinogen III methyltransferase/synthase